MLTLSEVLSDFKRYAGHGDDVHVSIDSRGNVGESPLHWMSTLGDHVGIQLLVEAGANVNATDDDGNTPLHEAVSRRHTSAAKALIAGGADVNLKNRNGQTAFDIARADGFQPTIELLT